MLSLINSNANKRKSRPMTKVYNDYYTYAFLRENGSPYYIGKGKGKRIYNQHRKGAKPPKDKSRIIFLKQNLTEEEAFRHERYMIFLYGRKDLGTGILHNLTDGGEGSSGLIHTEETLKKMSEAQSGENNPFYGKKHTPETLKKISEAKSGENHPMYGKTGENNPNYGKKHTPESLKKMSEVKSGENNPMYGKTGKNAPRYGSKHTPETRKKMSEAMKGKYSGENNPMYGKTGKNAPRYGIKHTPESRKQMSEKKKGKKWWNDGCGNALCSKECPGDGWVSGRGRVKMDCTANS